MLQSVLVDYLGEDSEVSSPEDETEAWQLIVRDCRDGLCFGLRREVENLLQLPDDELFAMLRTHALAWARVTSEDARRTFEGLSEKAQPFSNKSDEYASRLGLICCFLYVEIPARGGCMIYSLLRRLE
jgi:hypothetical protein